MLTILSSLAGCPDAALQNIRNAAEQGQEYEALGMLICDWSGKGHVTDPLFSLPSLVAMAGLSWNKKVDQVHVCKNTCTCSTFKVIPYYLVSF